MQRAVQRDRPADSTAGLPLRWLPRLEHGPGGGARERDEAEAAREVQQTPHGRRKESFVGERELREV